MNKHSTNPRSQSAPGQYNKGKGNSPRGRSEIEVNPIEDNWITEAITAEAIDYCERYGKELEKNKLTTSQIRNFYGEVMRIKGRGFEKEKTAILMLRPKLAYTTSKSKAKGSKMLNAMLQPALILASKNDRAFVNFCAFIEALVAFHKVHVEENSESNQK